MINNENCAFYIYTNDDETTIESFDYIDELKEICKNNNLNIVEKQIYLFDGNCDILNDADFNSFYDLQLKHSITDLTLLCYEMGELFEHQK